MGLKDFMEYAASSAEKAEAAKMGFLIRDGDISCSAFTQRAIAGPVAGARAEVISGTDEKRITATRVLAFGLFAPLLKKKTTKVFIIVTCANGVELVSDLDAKSMEAKARKWASGFNSRHANG
jgi:hypothetical protein